MTSESRGYIISLPQVGGSILAFLPVGLTAVSPQGLVWWQRFPVLPQTWKAVLLSFSVTAPLLRGNLNVTCLTPGIGAPNTMCKKGVRGCPWWILHENEPAGWEWRGEESWILKAAWDQEGHNWHSWSWGAKLVVRVWQRSPARRLLQCQEAYFLLFYLGFGDICAWEALLCKM